MTGKLVQGKVSKNYYRVIEHHPNMGLWGEGLIHVRYAGTPGLPMREQKRRGDEIRRFIKHYGALSLSLNEVDILD